MMPYGMRIAVRTSPRTDFSPRCITKASAKPSSSSTATVTTVISSVTPSDCQNNGSPRMFT